MRRPASATLLASLLLLAVSAAATASTGTATAPQWDLDWARDAVFYEVFVRSFADSNGDGVGDLNGLTAKLDYLNDGDPATTSDLGVTGLWLMPIFASPSYHGYDAVDYRRINPDYGSDADFDRFLTEAHRRGIRVILDLMINHTSSQHPWFVESASDPASPKRDWYVWRTDDPGWKQPWGDGPTWHAKNGAFYYGIFWGGMPDLNFDNPAVRAEITDIARYWLGRGVDGFRLDAARHISADGPGEQQNDTPRTHAFWREFTAGIRATYPRALLLGENWTQTDVIASYYGSTATVKAGDELPMSFDFPLGEAILKALQTGDASPVTQKVQEVAATYPAGALDAIFLTNHDMPRVARQLGSDPALAAAATLLLTLPGTPFVYYGEELGMSGGEGGDDRQKRTPMPWTSDQNAGFTTATPWFAPAPGWEAKNVERESKAGGSLLNLYRRLIHLRRQSPALSRGSFVALSSASTPSPLLAFVREAAGERLLVVVNVGGAAAVAGTYSVGADSIQPLLASDGSGGPWLVEGGGIKLELPAYGAGIWRLGRQR